MMRINLFLLSLCFCAAPSAAKLFNVYVSIAPQKYIVERIGGEYVNVHVMLGAGETPETFSPTPKKLSMLAGSVLYFRMDLPFEDVWIEAIQDANADLRIIDCTHSLIARDRIDGDFHTWTDPHNVIAMARIIKQALINIDPAHERHYERNFNALKGSLEALIVWIHEKLKHKRTSYFLVAHASWGYYARAFGLKQLALERHSGHVGPGAIGEMIKIARRESIHTVFTQAQIDPAGMRIFADEIGADVVVLDPLAEDYIHNMKDVTLKISKAMQ